MAAFKWAGGVLMLVLLCAPLASAFAQNTLLSDIHLREQCDRAPIECQQRCDQGDADSCHHIAELYDRRLFTPMFLDGPSRKRAAKYYERACYLGAMRACFDFSKLILLRKLAPRPNLEPLARSLALISFIYQSLSCASGDARGCFHLAAHHGHGLATARDFKRTLELTRQSCEMGYSDGCLDLAIDLDRVNEGQSAYVAVHDGEPWVDDLRWEASDPKRIDAFYKQACKGHSPTACSSLASRIFFKAKGKRLLPRDRERYVYYRELSCQYGGFYECMSLSQDYLKDDCFPTLPLPCNEKRGYELLHTFMPQFEKYCAEGFLGACQWLGISFDSKESFDGVPQDLSRALPFYQKVCNADPEDFEDECKTAAKIRQRIAKGEK